MYSSFKTLGPEDLWKLFKVQISGLNVGIKMQSFGLGQQQNCHGSAAPVSSLSL